MQSFLRTASALAFALLLAVTARPANAAETVLPLWPGIAPGDTNNYAAETDLTKPTEGLVAGKRLIRLGNVSQPTITVYKPSKFKANGASVVICPGGGYTILALDLEGTEVAKWLNSIGVTAIVLKYRVPARPGRPRYEAPLQDAQRAMGLVRQHAKEWGISENRIGVLGFSAGGHLAAAISNNYTNRTYETIDAADSLSCRPDFSVLVYPAYLVTKEDPTKISPELPINSQTPPAFIVQAEDDGVTVDSSLSYFRALKNAKVQAELHLYPTGGHGYGMRPTTEPVTGWPKLAEAWMKNRGLLNKN